MTSASERGRRESRESRKKEDDAESVDTLEELDDEGFDDESCEDGSEARVRFKVRGLLRVNI